jgi:hypothetical protein
VLFTGCAQTYQNSAPKTDVPQWMSNPNYITNKTHAIGCANMHIKGEDEQKKLAISRAIEQIALQKSTTVDVATYRKSVNNGLKKDTQSSSLQATQATISTKVVETYKDKNGKICVLVVEQ